MKRAILLIMDSAGMGPLPDWADFDEEPGDTLVHVAAACGGLALPNLQKLGLGNIRPLMGCSPAIAPLAAYGRCATRSRGKDTTTGHWEMMGLITATALPTFPQGFPPALVARLEAAFGTKILGNKAASGTAIISELGDEHRATGYPIVYTSADSVLQIACHEQVYSHEQLYELCRRARALCRDEYGVGRVIARPFEGESGHYERNIYRHDFALTPPPGNYLDYLQQHAVTTCGVGKIGDIFDGRYLTESLPEKGNRRCLAATKQLLAEERSGFYFVNLVDFDMQYGHRNDAAGYGHALEEFDQALGRLLPRLHGNDLLLIAADHGNDPTTQSTDHNREYAPLLSYCPGRAGRALGDRASLADIGATICRFLTGSAPGPGNPWEV